MPSNKSYYLLWPANFKLDGGAMFGIIPKPLWNKVHPSDELNRIELALRLWLIETPDRLILVDTGIGDYHDEKFNTNFDVQGPDNPLALALSKIGKSPEHLTDLIISHLHFDHVGGIGVKREGQLQPVFKNARLHLHQDHYHYAHHATERDRGSFHTENFDPIVDYYKERNQLVWHEGESGELIKEAGLKFMVSHGHTPFLMHPYDEKLIYLADLIPTAGHIHIPWVMGYDIAPGVTTQDKAKFEKFIMDQGLTTIFEHDPFQWGCKITQDAKGRFVATSPIKARRELVTKVEI